ncbi:hypothetical protein ACFPIJ_22300 [Dactylosporangium cerinum]|uniref:Uncharacterized protein n=1 Tax=Dactylosporangium cerinum TaxID=1434730 RepID=A0ABV9VXJ3_9ACTN
MVERRAGTTRALAAKFTHADRSADRIDEDEIIIVQETFRPSTRRRLGTRAIAALLNKRVQLRRCARRKAAKQDGARQPL